MRLFIACMLTLVIYIMICVCEQKGKEVPKVSQQLKIDQDYPTLQLLSPTSTPNPPYIYIEIEDSTTKQNPTEK